MLRGLLLLPAVLGGLLTGAPDEGAALPVSAGVSPGGGVTSSGIVGSSSVDGPAGGGPADGAGPACEAPQPGFLSVATTPWTAVVVDDVRVGTTPLFRLPLAPGAHRITFFNETAGVSATEDVEIGEGELRKLKLVFLTAAEREAALDESRAEAARDEDDCLATDVEHAFLSVDVKPWARVVVDGRAVGTTPLFRHRVSPGPHRVVLVGPGGERTAARFDAAADETVKLALTFVSPSTTPAAVDDAPVFSPDQPR
jgi:hypothetical protein